MMSLPITGIVAFILSYVAVRIVRGWASRRGVLDVPNQRSAHVAPTPRGGGIVFYPLVVVALLVHALLTDDVTVALVAWFAVLGGAVALVSWLDDLRSVRFQWRLAVQVGAAVGAMMAFGYWRELALPWLGIVRVEAVGAALTLIWIVGLTNAYNFMDGIDGIAGVQALVAGLAWLTLSSFAGWAPVGVVAVTVVAASLGFLAHNWSPARIFMGDVGAAFLGFTLAVLPLVASPVDPFLPIAACSIVWPFVADAGYTFIARLARGEKVWEGHRSHLYQRLVHNGWSHAQVSLLYGFMASVGVVLALPWFLYRGAPGGLLLPIPVLFGGLLMLVRRVERRESAAKEAVARNFTR